MLEVCAPAMRSMEDVSKRWVFKMGIPCVSAISSWHSLYFARKVQGYFPSAPHKKVTTRDIRVPELCFFHTTFFWRVLNPRSIFCNYVNNWFHTAALLALVALEVLVVVGVVGVVGVVVLAVPVVLVVVMVVVLVLLLGLALVVLVLVELAVVVIVVVMLLLLLLSWQVSLRLYSGCRSCRPAAIPQV